MVLRVRRITGCFLCLQLDRQLVCLHLDLDDVVADEVAVFTFCGIPEMLADGASDERLRVFLWPRNPVSRKRRPREAETRFECRLRRRKSEHVVLPRPSGDGRGRRRRRGATSRGWWDAIGYQTTPATRNAAATTRSPERAGARYVAMGQRGMRHATVAWGPPAAFLSPRYWVVPQFEFWAAKSPAVKPGSLASPAVITQQKMQAA
jgi:hypothetical protein